MWENKQIRKQVYRWVKRPCNRWSIYKIIEEYSDVCSQLLKESKMIKWDDGKKLWEVTTQRPKTQIPNVTIKQKVKKIETRKRNDLIDN